MTKPKRATDAMATNPMMPITYFHAPPRCEVGACITTAGCQAIKAELRMPPAGRNAADPQPPIGRFKRIVVIMIIATAMALSFSQVSQSLSALS